MKEHNELQQIASDCNAIAKALKTELENFGERPMPHQHAAVRSCEQYLISNSGFLALSEGQQDYIDKYMTMIERINP